MESNEFIRQMSYPADGYQEEEAKQPHLLLPPQIMMQKVESNPSAYVIEEGSPVILHESNHMINEDIEE